MTVVSENEETSQNQIKVKNYNVTYDDVAKVFSKIKNKGILNETIILDGQAECKTVNKDRKRKSKKHVKREEEFEL